MLVISLLLNAACAFYFLPKIWNRLHESQITTPKISYWMERDHYFDLLPEDSLSIVFLGTSITHNFELEESFGVPHLQNRGINGDDLYGITARMDAITRQQPLAIFIEAGINDLGNLQLSPKEIQSLMKNLLDAISKKTYNKTDVFVLSILPVSNQSQSMPNYCSPELNREIEETNRLYKNLCTVKGMNFIDVHSSFISNGEMNPTYTTDGVHLSGEGYMKLSEILQPYINQYQ